MEQTKVEVAGQPVVEQPEDAEVRTLKDLEMLLVGGGGDDTPTW